MFEILFIFLGAGFLGLAYWIWLLNSRALQTQGVVQKLESDSLVRLEERLKADAIEQRKELRESLFQFQQQVLTSAQQARSELSISQKEFSLTQQQGLKEFYIELKKYFAELAQQFQNMSVANEGRLNRVTDTLDKKLGELQEKNDKKLEEIRVTVDEKLQKTLNDRFAESFHKVSNQLEAVHKGLGEMTHVAQNVGDLKKILANVKTRGILGEMQLGALLSEALASNQYEKNVLINTNTRETVEFAVKFPIRDENNQGLYLPIDSKFPLDPYERLLAAYDSGQADLIKECSRELENSIKKFAKDIRDKYIHPPQTSDFAIMFLPVEGLFAEVVRQTSLSTYLYREFKVVVTGPSTLMAMLNTFQVGFQTLAFEKRSNEIRKTLAAVKTEFSKFGEVLDKVKSKLHDASNEMDKLVGVRTRSIQQKLLNIEALPEDEAQVLIDPLVAVHPLLAEGDC